MEQMLTHKQSLSRSLNSVMYSDRSRMYMDLTVICAREPELEAVVVEN